MTLSKEEVTTRVTYVCREDEGDDVYLCGGVCLAVNWASGQKKGEPIKYPVNIWTTGHSPEHLGVFDAFQARAVLEGVADCGQVTKEFCRELAMVGMVELQGYREALKWYWAEGDNQVNQVNQGEINGR